MISSRATRVGLAGALAATTLAAAALAGLWYRSVPAILIKLGAQVWGDALIKRSQPVIDQSPRGVDAGGWHPIEVKLKSKKGKVAARRGYSR